MSDTDEEASMYRSQSIPELERSWANDLRWRGIARPYSAADVDRLALAGRSGPFRPSGAGNPAFVHASGVHQRSPGAPSGSAGEDMDDDY